MSLQDKIVDDEKELIGKKIVAINLYDPYPLGYIILEGGELICFEENDDEISISSYTTVERKLMYNNDLRKLFLEHNCISQEDCNKYESFIAEQKKQREAHDKVRDYKTFLELSVKFKDKKIIKKENIFNGKTLAGRDYLTVLEKAIENSFYYFSFNGYVYSVEDREMNNSICSISDLI